MKDKNSDKYCKPTFFEKLNKGLDIDCDMLCRGFCAELKGRNHAEICGVKRILSYIDTELSFVTSDGIFVLKGSRLYCASYRRGAVIVEGDIRSMGFDNGGDDGDI